MKKFIKGLAVVGAIAGGVAGVIYLLNKNKLDEGYDEFDDESFDDVFDDDDDRDYVTLDFDEDQEETEE
jgi:Na+-translocating ferredoxin:NAD+ oxidoreductase RnfG subunit